MTNLLLLLIHVWAAHRMRIYIIFLLNFWFDIDGTKYSGNTCILKLIPGEIC